MIREGRVEVNGKTVTEMGTRVNPDEQQIRVDSELLRRPKKQYFLINKPVGILSTSRDPSGRPRVIDLAPSHERLFTVGRLDKSSDGLILVTNDGQLTDLLTHPRYGVEKRYLAQVAGVPTAETVAKLRRGVQLSEGFAHAKRVHIRRTLKHSTILEIVLDEGRNREVRRLFARVGHKVMKLRRTALGPLRLADLKPGESRPLRREEVEELYQAAREGHRKQAQDRQERRNRLSSISAIPSDEIVSAEVHPLIDKSLPPETLASDDDRKLIGSDVSEVSSLGEGEDDFFEDENDDEFAGLSDETDFSSANFDADARAEDIAPVDLRPFVRGKSGPQKATIIGGDERRKPAHRKKGSLGRKKSRHSERSGKSYAKDKHKRRRRPN